MDKRSSSRRRSTRATDKPTKKGRGVYKGLFLPPVKEALLIFNAASSEIIRLTVHAEYLYRNFIRSTSGEIKSSASSDSAVHTDEV